MSNRRSASKPVQGPQLGDTTFEEWYETPVFDADGEDERLEHLATSKRAPLRLVGSTAISLKALLHDRRETVVEPEELAPVVDLRDGLRRRVDGLLDRWARAEVAGQARLEDLVLPKRWRG